MANDDHSRVPFLRIFGRLRADNRLVLRPGYLIDEPREREPARPATLIAEVLGADDGVLVRLPLSVSRYCGSRSLGETLAVRGSVPLPEEAARVVVSRPDNSGRAPIIVADLQVPSTAPDIRILDEPNGVAEGRQVVTWHAEGDPAPVEYMVSYSHDDGLTWQPVGQRTLDLEAVLDVDDLPGGERCKIAVLATNGMRSKTAVSQPFQVVPKPCRALIQQPLDGERLTQHELLLVGNGWWLEDSRPELEQLAWCSDQEGELGRGSTVRARLSPGRHTLTLRAGEGDRVGEASVTVDVASQATST